MAEGATMSGSRALVLAGGGVGGIAWHVGLATGLADYGVDLTAADVLIGTSAGAAVGAQLATGQLGAAARMQQDENTSELSVEFDIGEFFALMGEVADSASSRQDATYRMANLPLVNTSTTAEQRRAAVAARLPVQTWPDRDLRLVAVAQDDGQRVVLDRHSGATLVDAVLASCAVPGMWRPVSINGRDYVDGGVYSLSNADLAAGFDRTIVLVPTMLDAGLTKLVHDEAVALQPGTAHIIGADEASVAAIGPNPLDPSTRPAVFAAARAQAAQVATELARFWN
jgi:NTE family protein